MVRNPASVVVLTVTVAACSGSGNQEDRSDPNTVSHQGTGGSSGVGSESYATGGDSPAMGGQAAVGPRSTASGRNGGAGSIATNGGPTASSAGLGGHDSTPASRGSGAGFQNGGVAPNDAMGATGVAIDGGSGSGSESIAAPLSTTCASLPAVSDYGAPGPFADVKMFTRVGPNSNFTLFRPDTTLGKGGFLHPIAAWGNGISTTPEMYQKTLTLIASHGFVIVACNDTQAEAPCLSSGLDWLAQQNTTSSPMQGKLDVTNEVLIGYSWGGGAAIDTSVRLRVRATVSLHGMPPREDPWGKLHAPLLLFTSTGDNFVTPTEYVTPNYESSTVQTFYATLDDSSAGHLYVVDEGAAICIGALLAGTFGNCGNAALERAPTVAWLRMWACSDANAKRFFYGDDCALCNRPWTGPQRKQWQ
ncbi:MAG: dienelactone hydrolase family protein [Myxococcales bacterium]